MDRNSRALTWTDSLDFISIESAERATTKITTSQATESSKQIQRLKHPNTIKYSTSSKRAANTKKIAKIDRHAYYDPYPVMPHKGEHYYADEHSTYNSLSGKYAHNS